MAIEAYVTSKDADSVSTLKIDDKELLATLGDRNEAMGLKLRELFDSVIQSITPSIRTTSQLSLEITGTVNMKANAGITYLLFNIGGEAGKSSTMKVTLSTQLVPSGGR